MKEIKQKTGRKQNKKVLVIDKDLRLCYFEKRKGRAPVLKEKVLQDLKKVTPEEQAILDGQATIDRQRYMDGQGDVVNSRKLLSEGMLITIRPNIRFAHFPEHRHDYIELVYICSGQVRHIVDGKQIVLKAGELLFLGQKARHQVCKTGMDDIAVNFIVLPEFFGTTLSAIGEEATTLRRFLIDCLFGQGTGPGYLLFRVSQQEQIQNLMANLIMTLLYPAANRRKISQLTMTLLFLELLGRTEALEWDASENLPLKVLQYVEEHYADGSLAEAAAWLHMDISALSREIHRKTGKTYTQLVQDKRLSQASFLLRTTDWTVDSIARAVGYENVSYFHKLFQKHFGQSPRQHRISK